MLDGWAMGSGWSRSPFNLLDESGIEPFLLNIGRHLSGNRLPSFFQSETLFLNIPFRRDFIDPWDYKRQIEAVIELSPNDKAKKTE